jgi:PAS domain S-box-containing protein
VSSLVRIVPITPAVTLRSQGDLRTHDGLDEALRKARLFDAFLETTLDHVYFKDAESRFTLISRSLAEWMGMASPDEAVGKTDFDIFEGVHAQEAFADEQEIIRTGHPLVNVDERETWRDGPETWVSTTKLPLRAEDGAIVGTYGVSRDITARKRVELEVEHRRKQMSAIIETQREAATAETRVSGPPSELLAEAAGVSAGTSEVNLGAAMNLLCERVTTLTPARAAAVLLLEGDELRYAAATNPITRVVDTRIPLREALVQRAFARGRAFHCRTTSAYNEPDAQTAHGLGLSSFLAVPLLHGETLIGLLVGYAVEPDSLSDDDERTLELLALVLAAVISQAAESRAKQDRLETLAQFQTMFEAAPIGILKSDLDGRVLAANPEAERMLGYSSAQLAKLTILDLTHPDDRAENRQLLAELRAGERESYEIEQRYVRTDGVEIWAHVTTALERKTLDGAGSAVTMVQDVTARKAAEEQVRQSQKIEAIGQLAAGIAHDFNNLLMGVLGYTGLAREAVDVDRAPPPAQYLEKIEQAAQRAAELTKQLLAFGRRQTFVMEPVDLNALVVETLTMLNRLLGEHIEIVSLLAPDLPELRADPTQLQQVLLNLALNARDAMPQGGTLEIRTEAIELDGESASSADLEPGRYVCLRVRDTGIGMTDAVRERLFEPFFTTKGIGEGSGLGLASVYGIVKQSRGDIAVESTLGEGTIFSVYLPVAGI